VDLPGDKVANSKEGTPTLADVDLTISKGRVVGSDSLRGKVQTKSEPSSVQLNLSYNAQA
jgi:hypothetical protein